VVHGSSSEAGLGNGLQEMRCGKAIFGDIYIKLPLRR